MIKKWQNILSIGVFAGIFLLAFFVFVPEVQAAACTFTSAVATGNWSAGGSWTPVGTACSTYPGQTFTGDTVIIASGNIITLDVSPANTVGTITINAPAANNGITFSGTNSLTSGVITLTTPGANFNGTIAIGAGTLTASSIALNGGTNANRYTAVTISTGTLNVSGNITNGGTASRAQLTFTGAGTCNIGGNFTPGAFTQSTSTVNFNGAGAQNIGVFTYYNLSTSTGGTKTTTGITSIGGALNVGTGTTFATGATNTWTLSVTGATTVTGTLTLNNTGNKTFTGNVTLNSGAVWNEASISAIGFGGDLTNNATTFTANTGTHTFSGGTKILSGSTTTALPGTATFTGAYTNNGTLSAATLTTIGVTVTNNGTVTTSTALSGTGGFTQGTTGVLNHAGSTIGITTFTASASGNTVNYNDAAQTVRAVTYHHLTLSNSGAKTLTGLTTVNGDFSMSGSATATTASALAVGGNVDLSGTSSLTGGTAITLTGNFTLGATATFVGGAFTHNIAGHWANNGGTFTNTGTTINLNGSLNQNISGSANTTFEGLTINNSAGVTLVSTVPTVAGTLTLTSGNITTGANNIYINSTGSVSRTSGHIVGNLRKYITTGATTKTFEIGDASNYAPVDIAFGNVTGANDLTIKTTAGDHPNIGTSTINSSKSVNRYWTTTDAGITFDNYSAVFNFINPGDLDGGASTSSFIVGKYNAGWTYPTVGTKNSTNTQITGATSFSDFQLGEKKTNRLIIAAGAIVKIIAAGIKSYFSF